MDINKTLIFDIGANRGHFTDKCLTTYKNVKVIVIEPNPNLYKFLIKKYKNNPSIIILDKIVSSEDDVLIDFYISNTDTISTAEIEWINKSRFSGSYNWSTPIKIRSISLNTLIEEYGNPDLIKIDVEGYELDVIKGLSSKQKDICFEWAEEQYDKINQTCDYLEKIGYTEFGFINGDDYLIKPNKYTKWTDSDFHIDINPERKIKWGMIWVK